MADDPKVDLTTDAAALLHDADGDGRPQQPASPEWATAEIGRIRREFLSAAAIAVLASHDATDGTTYVATGRAWADAEDMLAEGQRRGHLP